MNQHNSSIRLVGGLENELVARFKQIELQHGMRLYAAFQIVQAEGRTPPPLGAAPVPVFCRAFAPQPIARAGQQGIHPRPASPRGATGACAWEERLYFAQK